MRRTTHEKECLTCGERYTSYRSDSKYCSNGCRGHAHYQKAEESRADAKERDRITKRTNEILWNNRQILIQFNKSEVDIEALKEKGFMPEYITRRRITRGKIVFEVYDVTAIEVDVERFRIGKYLDR